MASRSDLATKTGFWHQVMATLNKFETYTGACDTKNSSKPLGPQVVFAILLIVENHACHCVYFDNFFTSYHLL